jgi:hypothetical protein
MSVESVIKMHENEKVVGVVRQFPLVFVKQVILAALLFSAPFFFMLPLFGLGAFGVAVFVVSVLAGLFVGFRGLVRWYWTVFIVTSHRVVDVDQRGLFDRFVSEASFEKIQDVSYARRGFWGTVLNFGTLVVQTAGTTAHLEQYYVRQPQDIQHMIVKAMGEYLAGPESERTNKVSTLLEAAAGLTNTEARAFLTELKGAVDQPHRDMVDAEDDDVARLFDQPER